MLPILTLLLLLSPTFPLSIQNLSNSENPIKNQNPISPIFTKTPLGVLEGFFSSSTMVSYYFGVPFAEPAKRFSPAVGKLPWQDVLVVNELKPICYQNMKGYPMDENCLYLNIYVPFGSALNLPVMVWIHGGGFQDGAGSGYNGTALAQRGIIVVTIHYRLGIFGFFSSNEIKNENPNFPSYGGMNGIHDQILALQWVKQNIQSFGGDPNQITIFGESAGGLSICLILVIGKYKGLYKNAIIESGSCLGPWGPADLTTGLNISSQISTYFNATSLDALRSVPPETILTSPLNLYPTLDKYLLPEFPNFYYQQGSLSLPAGGSILTGTNTLDTIFISPWYNGPFPNSTHYYPFLQKYFGEVTAKEIYSIYPPIPSPQIAVQKMLAHMCLVCPTKNLVKLTSHLFPTYLYEFTWDPQNPGYPGHFAEVPQVFGTPFQGWNFSTELSKIMMDYWVSFAKNGIPVSSGNPNWAKLTAGEELYVVFTDKVHLQVGYFNTECSFWNGYEGTIANYLKVAQFCCCWPKFL